MQNWKKVLIGVILLGGFALFTHYQKSTEPSWKVDEEKFNVVKTFQDGMNQEYNNLDELRVVDKYGFLKDVKKEIPIESEYRTLRIDKVWNLQSRVYLLYSVDLKERDNGVDDIPLLQVKNMRVATDDGKELVASAALINSPTNYSEGFVYKHRLYRSLYMYPSHENYTAEEYQILNTATRIELQDTQLVTNDGTKEFKNIGFKVPNENIYDKVLETTPINKKITYETNQKITVKDYVKMFSENRLYLEMNKDNALVGFGGETNQRKMFWEIVDGNDKGYFLPMYNEMARFPFAKKNKKTKITFEDSLVKGEKEFSFTIPKEEIMKINKGENSSITKNELIGDEHDTAVKYMGLSWMNGVPSIDISVTNSQNPVQGMDSYLFYLQEGWHYDGSDEDPNLRNVVRIKGNNNEQIKYYQFDTTVENETATYHIKFFQQPNDGEELSFINIPEKDLTITISDLVYTKPLPSPVEITLTND